MEDDRIRSIRPDEAHVATRGFSCVKGLKQQEIYSSPDRLMHPLKKVNGKHVRISWEQAMWMWAYALAWFVINDMGKWFVQRLMRRGELTV